MSATTRVKAIVKATMRGLVTDIPVWVIDFWRFMEILGDEGLCYYLKSGYHTETVRVCQALREATCSNLRDFTKLLRELTISRPDLDTNGWLYDELFMEYLLSLETQLLQFNVEELCSAVLEHLDL